MYYCTFCKKEGHLLERCDKAASILAGHAPDDSSSSISGSRLRCNNCRRQDPGKPKAKVGQTTVVGIGGAGCDEELDYSRSDDGSSSHPAKAGNAVALISPGLEISSAVGAINRDANIDLGCSVTMTPCKNDVLAA
ncbi:hypothetical protein PCASD_00802 [Puccinia coronata f. sp. avenae]|uniref:Uncharacterized protein n=1 Tax=Puccinia coronata f. sp. avenae TaxID=200324 RepID=A0A2N5VPC6_9BASI|nr:hypothetical protein PCASD_00802 [Puccinia coronata f. sp. avenae]